MRQQARSEPPLRGRTDEGPAEPARRARRGGSSSSSSFSAASRPTYPTSSLPFRREPAAEQARRGAGGWKACEVDPTAPALEARDPERPASWTQAGRRRRQRAVDLAVDLAGQRRCGACSARDVVPLGEADQVGLVDRDDGDVELVRGPDGLVAQRRGRGDVDHVGREAGHHRAQPAPGLEPDPEVGVERQVRAASIGSPGTRRTAAGPVGATSSAS